MILNIKSYICRINALLHAFNFGSLIKRRPTRESDVALFFDNSPECSTISDMADNISRSRGLAYRVIAFAGLRLITTINVDFRMLQDAMLFNVLMTETMKAM